MKPLSKPAEDLNELEKQNELIKDTEKVDINALFVTNDSKDVAKHCDSDSVHYSTVDYAHENQTNRDESKSRKRERLNRGLAVALVFIVSICCLGLILSITGAIYLQSYRHKVRTAEESILGLNVMPASSTLISDNKLANISSETDKPENGVTNVNSDDKNDSNDSNDLIFRPASNNEDLIDSETLNKLEPNLGDYEEGRKTNIFETKQTQFRFEETPTLLDLIRYIRRLLNLPRVHFHYDD